MVDGGRLRVGEDTVTKDLDAYAATAAQPISPNFAALKRRRILIIDSTPSGRERMIAALADQAFQLDTASSLEDANRHLQEYYYDAALLGLTFPDKSALDIVQSMNCPVIIMSSPASVAEILEVVNSGAADFVTDQVSNTELAVRIWKIIFNPPSRERQTAYNFGAFKFDSDRRTCTSGGRQVGLTPHEAEFLQGVIEGRRHFATYGELIRRIWGERAVETQNLRVLAAQVRKKIEQDAERPELLVTVFGRGYRFVV